MRIHPRFVRWLATRACTVMARRTPDQIITGIDPRPYLRRWWLLPKNRLCNLYLHEILRDDRDRVLYDHPWPNVSLILDGAYLEILHKGSRLCVSGSVICRRATTAHRLELINGEPCLTLFLTGPRFRVWGFHCPQGWVPWQNFVSKDDPGAVGAGCGES